MHSITLLRTSLLAALIATAPIALSAADKAPTPTPGNYPLKTCVVSDEPLGADTFVYIHKEAGKPDREIRFCCEGCVDDFKKEPAKFLKKLDDAAKAQGKKK